MRQPEPSIKIHIAMRVSGPVARKLSYRRLRLLGQGSFGKAGGTWVDTWVTRCFAQILAQRVQVPHEDGFWGGKKGSKYLLRRYLDPLSRAPCPHQKKALGTQFG